jgi:general L-amino acid transport system permease protein
MSVTDLPKDSFRLNQLIYDTRYRAITIQVVTLMLVAAGILWLGRNAAANLDALGLTPDFTFLGNRAGYDIGQSLITYDNSMSHGRAALVGIVNTLLVAGLGCVTATVLGVLAGVLRLSKNWVVAKLMAIYVEGFRNVPLLLWILLVFAIMTESTPAPSAFREGGGASKLFDGTVAITNRGIYVPSIVWGPQTWILATILVLSIIGAVFYRRYAKKLLFDTGRLLPMTWPALAIAVVPVVAVYLLTANFALGLLHLAGLAVWLALIVASYRWAAENFPMREMGKLLGVLLAICLGWLFSQVAWPMISGSALIYNSQAAAVEAADAVSNWNPWVTMSYPELGGFNFRGGLQISNPLVALWVALSLYTGAFIAEIVRAGILAVSKGQTEAAFALGMRPNRTMNLVILPQAMRVIIPPLISQFLNLTKNSSLAIAVGYADVRATLGGITLNQTGRALECMLLLGLFYLALSLAISLVMNLYNNSKKLKER